MPQLTLGTYVPDCSIARIRPFNGVSTKYLPNYLVWFQRIDSTNNIPRNVVASRLLDHSHTQMVFTTTKHLLSPRQMD